MPQKLSTATQLAPASNVNLAFFLIGYPEEVSNAMAFVLDDTLICAEATVKLVTFSVQVGGVRSVTLDGDVGDPSGMLLMHVQAEAEAALGEVEGTEKGVGDQGA